MKPFRWLRRIGLNLIILCVYFDPFWFHITTKKRPFMYTIAAVSLDQAVFVLGAIWKVLLDKSGIFRTEPNGSSMEGEELLLPMLPVRDVVDPFVDEEDDGNADGTKDEATNAYEDLTFRMSKLVPLCCTQLMLVLIYVDYYNSGGDDKNIRHAETRLSEVNVLYWLVAVILQMAQGDKMLGDAFDWEYWFKLLGTDMATWTIDSSGLTFRMEWALRGCLDFLVNGVSRSIILYTFPIMLCVEDPLDFVKDCTAVLFICTLDDLTRPRMLKELTAKLKFELYTRAEDYYSEFDTYPDWYSARQGEVVLTQKEHRWAIDFDNQHHFKSFEAFEDKRWKRFLARTSNLDASGHEINVFLPAGHLPEVIVQCGGAPEIFHMDKGE